LEKIYHQPYGTLVKKYISEPLEMNYTNVSYPENIISRLFAKGYNGRGIKMSYNHTLSILQPAGGICSSITDMLKYLELHLNEKNATIHLSHQPTLGDTSSSAIGLFWQIDKLPDGQLLTWHSGATFGFSGYAAIYPHSNSGIIVLTNEFDMGSLEKLTNLANEIAKQIF
jgi:CubicO group peptidase (beta-lactamase class C family)